MVVLLKAAAAWALGSLRLPMMAGTAALVLYAAFAADAFGQRTLAIAGVYALLVIGYQFILGHAGALSLAQGTFFGLGAYATAVAAVHYGLSLPTTLALSVLVPVALAAAVALPVLRLESHYFALATLGIAQVVWLGAVNWEDVTGGSNGLPGIPGLAAALHVAPRPEIELAAAWGAAALGGIAAWQIMRGLYGLTYRVMRAEPLAAGAAGINAGALRFTAFLLSAAYGGAAGALHVRIVGVVSPESLELPVLIACLTMAVVGGRTRVAGAIVGAVILIHLPEWFRFLEGYYLFAYGAAMLAMIVVAPEGLVGALEAWRARVGAPPAPETPPRPAVLRHARRPQRGIILEVDGLRKSFGGLAAVDGVTLSFRRSEIFGLIGPNGSGKTTLANMISGVYRPDAGRVRLAGRDITGWPAWRAARAGIGRTFQAPALVDGLSALDNVAVARAWAEKAGLLSALLTLGRDGGLGTARANALELLRRVGAEDIATVSCLALPHGLRRRVEIARALALAPDLLILDEPAAGLAEGEQADLAGRLRALVEDGLSLLIIEHNLPFLMPLAMRMACLDEGRVIAQGTPKAVRADPAVVRAYLGPTSPASATEWVK